MQVYILIYNQGSWDDFVSYPIATGNKEAIEKLKAQKEANVDTELAEIQRQMEAYDEEYTAALDAYDAETWNKVLHALDIKYPLAYGDDEPLYYTIQGPFEYLT